MARRPKRFDCVEMKRRAQEQLLAEYEARKGEFGAYWQFIEAKALIAKEKEEIRREQLRREEARKQEQARKESQENSQ